MKYRQSIMLILIITAVISLAAQAQQRGMRQDRIGRHYNPATEETITGTIETVTVTGPQGLHITVKSGERKVDVHLGPKHFLKDKITLAEGDIVTVTGSKVTRNGTDIILARTIKKGDKLLELRDGKGVPVWAGEGNRRSK